MPDFADLKRRVEKAFGPDRELDCLLWAAFDGRTTRRQGDALLAQNSRPPHDECVLGVFDNGVFDNGAPGRFTAAWSEPPFPPYTASLDATVGLVERVMPGALWCVLPEVETSPLLRGAIVKPQDNAGGPSFRTIGYGYHRVPALALLSALLAALIAGEPHA